MWTINPLFILYLTIFCVYLLVKFCKLARKVEDQEIIIQQITSCVNFTTTDVSKLSKKINDLVLTPKKEIFEKVKPVSFTEEELWKKEQTEKEREE